MNESIWQNCPVCKNKGKDNNKTTSKAQAARESSPMCRKGEEKVQLAEQINCNPFCSVFVMYYWMQSKNCGALFLWSCVASWPISEFKHLQQPDRSDHLHPPPKRHLSSTVSVAAFVDIKKSNVIEESLSQGTFMAGFQSHRGSERSLGCCRWGRNS